MSEKGKSEFWKWAEKTGRIKDVSEAFEKYPVEEEWHKGKIESFLNEPKEYLSIYNIGDIVYVKDFTYPNGKKGRNHLFVILDLNNYAVPINNITMLISSKVEKVKYETNKLLKKDGRNNLKTDSIVKTDEVYQIANSQISFRIGTVDMETIELYKNSYKLVTKSHKSIYDTL